MILIIPKSFRSMAIRTCHLWTITLLSIATRPKYKQVGRIIGNYNLIHLRNCEKCWASWYRNEYESLTCDGGYDFFFIHIFWGALSLKATCEINIMPNVFFGTSIAIVIHLYCRIMTSSTRPNNQLTLPESEVTSPPLILPMQPAQAQLTAAGQVPAPRPRIAFPGVVCNLANPTPVSVSQQQSMLPHQQFLPRSSNVLSAASHQGMFQGCSIGSIQVVSNNYMCSQARPNSAPVPVTASGRGGAWLISRKHKFKFSYGECVNVIVRPYHGCCWNTKMIWLCTDMLLLNL